MINRRRFLQSIAAAAAPSMLYGCRSSRSMNPDLQVDPNGVLDLPRGFSYSVVSRRGTQMDDGLFVPGAHDGMAAFPGDDGRIILICNHEMNPKWVESSAFLDGYSHLPDNVKSKLYDHGDGESPALGGTSTSIYNPATRETERQFLSLAGTESNCAGGPTPWGSWLSCEEIFEGPGTVESLLEMPVTREQKHGYVFEVPANATELVEAVPIKAMGRFEHEAAAVDSRTGIVYMTEDRHHSLFYRYIPKVPGKLHLGGRLQALTLAARPSVMTHNWPGTTGIPLHEPTATRWIDLDDVDSDDNDLRKRGAAAGAAMFARGEGLCFADDRLVFTCTIGGPDRLGQVFTYVPSVAEGTPDERDLPGQLSILAEAGPDSMLVNADNLVMAPWGDLIFCEDTAGPCGLIGIRPDRSQYEIANNPYSDSELAGVCFAPDGKTLFVNIQYPGMTIAISGPWPT